MPRCELDEVFINGTFLADDLSVLLFDLATDSGKGRSVQHLQLDGLADALSNGGSYWPVIGGGVTTEAIDHRLEGDPAGDVQGSTALGVSTRHGQSHVHALLIVGQQLEPIRLAAIGSDLFTALGDLELQEIDPTKSTAFDGLVAQDLATVIGGAVVVTCTSVDMSLDDLGELLLIG